MDEQVRRDANTRLKRIAGQVAGLERMLDEERYCVDILLQVAAVRAALAEVGRVVLASHVQTCLTDAVRSGAALDRQAKLDELMQVFSRYCSLGSPARSRPKGRSKGSKR
jgi:DNA-binding FrmR family transcriptional regulator